MMGNHTAAVVSGETAHRNEESFSSSLPAFRFGLFPKEDEKRSWVSCPPAQPASRQVFLAAFILETGSNGSDDLQPQQGGPRRRPSAHDHSTKSMLSLARSLSTPCATPGFSLSSNNFRAQDRIMKTSADSAPIARLKPEGRSRIANGSSNFLPGTDGRSALARRWRDIASQLTADLGNDPSEAQSLIARRAATLGVWAEQREAELAAGGQLDIVAYTTATNSLRRLLADLGLERRARDITPSLNQILSEVHRG